jgi:Tfp pilus assembly protein PilO
MSALTDSLKKVPFGLLSFVVAGYFGYQYYHFTQSADSELNLKKSEYEAGTKEIERLTLKAKEVESFKNTLETRKVQLRELFKRLDEMKSSISESVDNADFMNTVLTEAKKVGLNVVSFDRSNAKKEEYYTEHIYNLSFRGVYVQLLVFFERLATVQRLIRVDNFKLKPVSASNGRYVELEGVVELKAYNYELSNADKLGKDAIAPGSGS